MGLEFSLFDALLGRESGQISSCSRHDFIALKTKHNNYLLKTDIACAQQLLKIFFKPKWT